MFTLFSSLHISSLVNVCNGHWRSAGQEAHSVNQFVYHLTIIHIGSNGATVATLTPYLRHLRCTSISSQTGLHLNLTIRRRPSHPTCAAYIWPKLYNPLVPTSPIVVIPYSYCADQHQWWRGHSLI